MHREYERYRSSTFLRGAIDFIQFLRLLPHLVGLTLLSLIFLGRFQLFVRVLTLALTAFLLLAKIRMLSRLTLVPNHLLIMDQCLTTLNQAMVFG